MSHFNFILSSPVLAREEALKALALLKMSDAEGHTQKKSLRGMNDNVLPFHSLTLTNLGIVPHSHCMSNQLKSN